ncbi:hypothetical protein ACM66B_001646 [Microbotryomycetes sp. NB124-2]
MVWVVVGTVKNRKDDAGLSKPDETSHFLRPCRQYRIGRMGGVVIKEGTKPSLLRPIDFSVKANQVSKSGWCDWLTGGDDWDPIDNPKSPTNLAPYSLTVTCGQNIDLIRNGERTRKDAGSSFEVQSGDRIQGTATLAAVLEATFFWKPQVFSLSNAARLDELAKAAKTLGFKVATGGYKPHHSAWIAAKVKPTTSVLSALMRASVIADYAFIDELIGLAHVDPSTPHLLELFGLQTEQELEDLLQQPESAYLPRILAAKEDIGFDWKRYWGHSLLEDDFSLFPKPSNWMPPQIEFIGSDVGAGVLEPQPKRKSLFAGIVVVSYTPLADGVLQPLIAAGGGKYFASSLAAEYAVVSSMTVEVKQFLQRENLAPQTAKLVVLAPDNVSFKHEPGEPEIAIVLRDVARRLGVHKYVRSTDVIDSVLRVDTSNLFGVREPATAQAAGSRGARFQVPISSGVPGTHPEDTLRNPDFLGRQGTETQDSVVAGTSQAVPARKPSRRPPPGTRKRGFDALSSDDDDQPPAKLAAPSAAVQSSAAPAVPSSPAPTNATQARTQPRRTGRSRRIASLLSSDEDEDDQDASAGTSGSRSRQTREDPHTRRLRLEAEDEAAAEANRAAAKERAKQGLPVVQEDRDENVPVAGPSTRTRKRLASVALSADEDAVPATASTRNKRNRSASVQPAEPVAVPVPVSTTKKMSTTALKPGTKRAEASKRKEQDAALRAENQNLLQIKTTKRKTKEGQLNADLDAEFNKLKIVKPILLQMKPPTRHRMRWEEEDPDAEMNRLIADDQRRIQDGSDGDDHPDTWGGPSTQAFNVELVSLARTERPQPRNDLALDPKWAGKANFKRFRPKNALNGKTREPVKHRDIQLVADEPMDFGLGADYGEHRNQVVLDNEEDDDDDPDLRMGSSRQTKLNFRAKAAGTSQKAAATRTAKVPTRTKAATATKRGKGKQVAMAESDEEQDELEDDDDSGTLGRNREKTDDEMDVDSTASSSKRGKASQVKGKKAASSSTTAKSQRAPAATGRRKAPAPAMLLLSDSDDEDNRLTFRGFGATARR